MNKKFYIFLTALVLLIAGIFVSSLFVEDNTNEYNLSEILQSPGKEHLFGTDNMGRDFLIRLLLGSRNTILLALIVSIINIIIGFSVGLFSGYIGGIADTIFMRLVEGLLSLPSILIAVCLLGVFGGGALNLILFLTLTGWCSLARLVRNETIIIKEQEFIIANKVFGYSTFRNLFYHIMPNVFFTLVFYFIAMFIGEIYSIVSINFLGLGLTADVPDLGLIISDARLYLLSKPYLITFPVIIIFLLAVSLHVITDEVRDYFDKKRNLINFSEYVSVSTIKENYENE